ncbi:disks large homolog 5-like [Peromyscus californicus insignis]|uniref:disks large homolog 5-like n=1 Tax=Peromyscus californicus insignis TaxID=564181 RepID=UPI0022A714F6|nr:disks large homolog 5-like [Peromyscus californicus insignis]
MGDLRCPAGASQSRAKFFRVSLNCLLTSFLKHLLRSQGDLFMSCHNARSLVFIHLPTGTSKEPPPTPTSLTKKQVKQKVKSLTTQLQVMTAQRNDLRDRLILVTEGSLDNRPYHRPNPFWEKLKMEHQQVMSDLQKFENENLEASQKLSELTKDKVFLFRVGMLRHGVVGDQRWLTWSYHLECVSSDLQSRLLMEQSQLKKKLDMLKQEKENLLEDWVVLKHHLGDLQVLRKDQEEISDLHNQQQQVGTGSWVTVRSSTIYLCKLTQSTHPDTCALSHHFPHPYTHPSTHFMT